jgi:hypothetical protein
MSLYDSCELKAQFTLLHKHVQPYKEGHNGWQSPISQHGGPGSISKSGYVGFVADKVVLR